MKPQNETIHRNIHHGILFLITAAFIFVCITAKGVSLNPAEGGKTAEAKAKDKETSTCKVLSFTVKLVEGKNYLNWYACNSMDDSFFTLEKSVDGENYSLISIKKNFISPGDQKVQYSFVDEQFMNAEKIQYKLTVHKKFMDATELTIFYPANGYEESSLCMERPKGKER